MSPDTKLPLEELRELLENVRLAEFFAEDGVVYGADGDSVATAHDNSAIIIAADNVSRLLAALLNAAPALLSAAEERDALKRRVEEEKPHLYCAPDCDSLRDGGGYCTCADGWWAERMAFKARAEIAEAECLEQARVNGMGMEREAALIARAEKAEAALAEQTARAERWRDLASIAYHNMERGADVIILETGATWNDTFVDALGAEPPPPQEGAERE